MYPFRTRTNKANILLPTASTKYKQRVNKVLQHFDDLIDDNIFDNLLQKQQQIDMKQYFPIQIQHENLSMSVIIHKKKTYGTSPISSSSMFLPSPIYLY